MARPNQFVHDIVVVGGCGHVGLPLGLAFADCGLDVDAVRHQRGRRRHGQRRNACPSWRREPPRCSRRVLASGRLGATTDVGDDRPQRTCRRGRGHACRPLPEPRCRSGRARYHAPDRPLRRRSSARPAQHGVSRGHRARRAAHREARARHRRQLLSGAHRRRTGARRAAQPAADRRRERHHAPSSAPVALFRRLTPEIVELEPEEAELAKLFTNSWRYLKFAVANQLYMIANDNGLDYERIRHAVTYHYPRAADLPGAGLHRGTVPAQGHHADHRVCREPVHARPRRGDGQRGHCPSTSWASSSSASTLGH